MQQTDLSAKHLVHKFNLETFANSVHEVEEVEAIRHSIRFKKYILEKLFRSSKFYDGPLRWYSDDDLGGGERADLAIWT